MDQAQEAEARRVAVAVMLAAIDGRDNDLPALLANADRETMVIAVGGLAIAVGAALGEVHPDRRATIREGLAGCALATAGDVAMPEAFGDQRLLIGLVLAAHDGDELGFNALLDGVPWPQLRAAIRSLAEVVVGGQLATEDEPGAARAGLAREALNLAGAPQS